MSFSFTNLAGQIYVIGLNPLSPLIHLRSKYDILSLPFFLAVKESTDVEDAHSFLRRRSAMYRKRKRKRKRKEEEAEELHRHITSSSLSTAPYFPLELVCIQPTTSAMSQGWGDDSDALACLMPSLSTHSSDDDAGGCWGSTEDALANFVAEPYSSDDDGWCRSNDALAHFLGPDEGPSHALDNAGDIPKPISASPPTFQTGLTDLSALSADIDHWLNSDGEEDEIIQLPMTTRSASHSRSPPQSTSSSDSGSHSDYQLSTHGDLPKSSTPDPNDDSPLPRKHQSEEELFIGVGPLFWNYS
jgi:hypothetical protein